MSSRRFAYRLKLTRKLRGMSQRALSAASGFSPMHVRNLEGQRSEHVRLGDVEALAKVLRIDPAWLAFGTGSGPTQEKPRDEGYGRMLQLGRWTPERAAKAPKSPSRKSSRKTARQGKRRS